MRSLAIIGFAVGTVLTEGEIDHATYQRMLTELKR
jgi:hypothetical protein